MEKAPKTYHTTIAKSTDLESFNLWTDFALLVKFRLSMLVVITSIGAFYISAGLQVTVTQLFVLGLGGFLITAASNIINQVLEKDFDKMMIEFATAIYIMDAGPEQTIKKTVETFGLSETARVALRNHVHGPKVGGATFLAQFSTKSGVNTQLLTLTLGPIELWAFSTTAEDAILRNRLYKRLGAQPTRKVLARLFPNGSLGQLLEQRLTSVKEKEGFISEDSHTTVIEDLIEEILEAYRKNPDFKSL